MTVKRLVVCVVLMSAFAFAQSAMDGTWKTNVDKSQPAPDTISLQGGMYKCSSCTPPYSVKADGQDHPVSGSPYIDTASARQVDDRSVEVTEKKDGKTVGTTKFIAQDGNTLREEWTFKMDPNAEKTNSGTVTCKRMGAPVEGAHAVSGTWKPDKMENVSADVLTVTFKTMGDNVEMNSPLGVSYTGKFDGKEYPVKGVPEGLMVSLKKIDANTFEETNKRNGKVVVITKYKVSPDGKTMTMVSEDKRNGSTSTWVADKQGTASAKD